MEIGANELPRQGFMSRICFDGSKIKNVSNIGYRHDKPLGGFWTSSFTDSGLTHWQEWCKIEMPEWYTSSVFEMTPRESARIFKIDGWNDLNYLWSEYGKGNFEEVSKDFDAIFYTEKAVWECRHGREYNLYGVDVESAVWFRDVFVNS